MSGTLTFLGFQIQAQKAAEMEQILVKKNESLTQRILLLEEEQKEKEMRIQELQTENKQLKLQTLDERKYPQWNWEEIAMWIVNLDIDRMGKYNDVIRRNLRNDEVDGSLLSEVDGGDLRVWGIENMAGWMAN